MNTVPDVANLDAKETNELIAKCTQRLEALRQEAIQQAELLGLTCSLHSGDGAQKRKKRGGNAQKQAE